MKHNILVLAAAACCLGAGAQTISFDTTDCKAVGAYDTWEKSPFRTGALRPNIAVVPNHLADSINPSSNILGIQRSRYGSNTFGAEIQLNSPWRIGKEMQYVHLLIHKPLESRVMLIGLGNRADRPGQSQRVEQFWVYPLNDVGAGEWVDAVFGVKANNGVDIYSLVLVPDVRSDCKEDFVAYIDDIVISNDRTPRTGVGDYPINLPSQTMITRYDRRLKGITVNGRTAEVHNVPDAMVPLYTALLDNPFVVVSGEEIKAVLDYNGLWMHSYIYLDVDNDGKFAPGELMSFTPRTDDSDSPCNPPVFTLPAEMAPGIYRVRFKVDWDNSDPGGDSQSIVSNGGSIVDMLLNVHAPAVRVNNDNRNGEVLSADGSSLDNISVPFGKELTVRAVPSNGFRCDGIKVRHGYNLTGEAKLHSNPQYREEIIPAGDFAPDGSVVIPASMVDGDLLIEGLFVSTNS